MKEYTFTTYTVSKEFISGYAISEPKIIKAMLQEFDKVSYESMGWNLRPNISPKRDREVQKIAQTPPFDELPS